MRFLTWIAVVLLSGCSCDFEIFPRDECYSDSDCPDDDGQYCNGTGVCVGFFGSRCEIQLPDCWEGYCDDVSGSCRVCESPDDAYECSWRFDAGPPPPPDAGPTCTSRFPGGDAIGTACGLAGCGSGLACVAEITAELGSLTHTFAELCSPACDPSTSETDCGPCAACIDAVRVGDQRVALTEIGRAPHCAVRCEPSRNGTGCAREGFSCDVVTGTCQEACVSDADCRLVRDASGALVEDPTRPHFCHVRSRRCRLRGTDGAQIGGACTTDGDCTLDGVCLRDDGWPEAGYCTRLDCQWPALACGDGEQCHHRALERPACLTACTVGAEPEEDRLGAGGHGQHCAPGLSCRWDGRSGDVSPNGGCMPGNYNDVAAPNLGAPCTRDDECYSPFGLGRCAWSESGAGSCSLIDCGDAHPGIACDEGAACVPRGEDAFCLRTCASALECIAGHACAPAPSGSRVCAPSCTADADCRDGERCDGTECAFDGACRCVPL